MCTYFKIFVSKIYLYYEVLINEKNICGGKAEFYVNIKNVFTHYFLCYQKDGFSGVNLFVSSRENWLLINSKYLASAIEVCHYQFY